MRNLIPRLCGTFSMPAFNDREVQKIGQDVFLVAYALAEDGRVVVTRSLKTEQAARSQKAAGCL